jgi:glyoxylase-like metal-dependent hydrolase (beta-lactamase superfamily II)
MTGPQPVSRRLFLADLGRGAAAIAIVGLAGCAPSGSGSSIPSGTAPSTPSGSPPPAGSASPAPSTTAPPPTSGDGVAWQRVNLGFVSAYLLIRGGEAAIVDTGVAGSEGDIEAGLTAAGLSWAAVGHVILTHKHGDHAGSVEAVLERAAAAQGYAGAEDLPAISSPRTLSAVADGDDVFGLTIVTTPGHTPGHIAVYDPLGGIFVAGDAMRTSGGAVTPPGAQFTEDMAAAMASITKVGALSFETLLVGHGDPIESGASGLVAALGAGG